MIKSLTVYMVFLTLFTTSSLFSQRIESGDKGAELLWHLVHSEKHDSLSIFLEHGEPDLYTALLILEKKYGADSVTKSVINRLKEFTNTALTQTVAAAEVMIKYTTERKDTLYMARSYSLLANVISELGENQKALEYCLKALDFAKRVKDEELMLNLLNSLGTLHLITGDYPNSAAYYRRYIGEAKANNDLEKVAVGNLNIGNALSEDLQEDSARYFYEKALDIARDLNLKTVEAYALGNLAYLFVESGDIEKAIEYQKAGLKIEETTNDNIAMIDSHNVLATCYAKLGNPQQAIDHYQKAKKIALAINAKFKMLDLLFEGQQVFAYLGDFPTAYAISRKYQHLNDSLLNARRNAQFAELREKYETEQKEAKIEHLEEVKKIADLEIAQRRSENIALVVVVVLLLVVAVFIFVFLIQAKKRRKEIEARNETITKINKALNKSQDALIASNKTKDKFFALIAHDLRGPVTSMQGIGRMLAYYNKKGDEARINQLIEQVDQSASSVNHLLDNLLKWALSQTDGLNYQPTAIGLAPLIEEIRIIFEEAVKAKEIDLKIEQEEGVAVEADYNMISTVIRNLLSNAIKFSPPRGSIRLSISENETAAVITVSDSGQGMPQETIDKIFTDQPVSSTRGTLNEKGTGLGLVLCQEFVRKHGGELNITSSDSGTSISFQLTLTQQTQTA
ncbi:MAG: tetratricopeptide repeat-containing sensor histidine kinase [Cyclobacteriaceae bacterium]